MEATTTFPWTPSTVDWIIAICLLFGVLLYAVLLQLMQPLLRKRAEKRKQGSSIELKEPTQTRFSGVSESAYRLQQRKGKLNRYPPSMYPISGDYSTESLISFRTLGMFD